MAVVPDSSDRWNAAIVAEGRGTPGLSLAIAGSSHLVIVLLKIPATTCGVRINESTPETL